MLRLHHYTLPVIAAVLVVLLAGCGKKGPLYLPDSPPTPGHKQPKN
ncbi:MAG: lipoprotein [Pseudomonadota bacterium]